MIHLPLAILKGWKVCVGLFTLSAIVLAAAEESSNRTLIIISAITSGTSLLGVLISGLISLHNARVGAANSKKLEPLDVLPEKVEQIRKNTDGIQAELNASRLQTSEAKQELARHEGADQERTRQEVAATTPAEKPAQVEIVQPPGKSVPVKPDKD